MEKKHPPSKTMLGFRRIHGHFVLAVLALLLAHPAPTMNLTGVILVIVGLAIRLWAAGLLIKGGALCTDGPYRYVRHPLYLGSLLAALGFAVMMNIIWGWIVILPLFVLLYLLQVREEERHLRNTYGEEHAAFRAAVPLLLPHPWKHPPGKGRSWQWSQALANREHYHILITLAFVTLFFLKSWLR